MPQPFLLSTEKELHIGEGNAGIIEYPAETPTGALVRDVAKLEKPETVFDIEVTWNRPDALSIVGLAREFSAILNRPLTLPPVDFTECDVDVNDEVKVVVEDAVRCLRYTARVVTEMTPDHLSKDLDTAVKVGQRHGKPLIYEVSALDMYRDGYKFFISANGVWLTKEVPARYLNKQR